MRAQDHDGMADYGTLDNSKLTQANVQAGFHTDLLQFGGGGLVPLFDRPPFSRSCPTGQACPGRFATGLASIAPPSRIVAVAAAVSAHAEVPVPAQFRVRPHFSLCRALSIHRNESTAESSFGSHVTKSFGAFFLELSFIAFISQFTRHT